MPFGPCQNVAARDGNRRAKMPRQTTLKSIRKFCVVTALLTMMFGLPAGAAYAQDYPSKGVSLIVPYPAGGGVDAVGRLVAQKLTEALGQQVLVLNRPGAGSVIGVRDGAKAAPDGYTILMLVTGASLP